MRLLSEKPDQSDLRKSMLLADQFCLDTKSPYRQANLVRTLLLRFKYKVFYRRKWQQGIELALLMKSIVKDSNLDVSLQPSS